MRVAAFTSLCTLQCQATSLCVRRSPSRNKYIFFSIFFFNFFVAKFFKVFFENFHQSIFRTNNQTKKRTCNFMKKKYVSSHVCPMLLKPREKLRTTSDSHVQTCKITCFLRNFFDSRAVSISVWKVWKWLSLVAPVTPFPEPQGRAVSASVAKVAPEFFRRESLKMATLGRESLNIPNMSRDILVTQPPLRSQKSGNSRFWSPKSVHV